MAGWCPAKTPWVAATYWLAVRPIEEVEEGTDRWAIGQGYVSVTPIRLDLTDALGLSRHTEGSA